MNSNILKERRAGREVYLWYTLAFGLIAFIIIFAYRITGKSFIWWDDGLYQHTTSLAYYGKYLRSVFSGIFRGDFTLPMYDLSIGYGADISSTLNFYVFADPFAFFSVFVPERFTETLYAVLIFLRLWLCGISFMLFVRNRKKKFFWGNLCGALIYAFGGYMMFAGVRHPYFLNPCIFFPLLLNGVDRIFAGKRPWIFILSAAVSAFFNVYFLYMMCIGVFIYAVLEYFYLFGTKIKITTLFKWLFKFICFFAVGLMLAAVVLLPSSYALLSAARTSAEASVSLLYPVEYYKKFIFSFIGVNTSGYWTRLAFTGVGAMGVILMFVRGKAKKYHIAAFCIFTLFLLFPYFGHLFNGLSYVSNRWEWIYCLLVAYITMTSVADMDKISHKSRYIAGYIGMGICVILAGLTAVTNYINVITIVQLCVVSLCILATVNNEWAARISLAACCIIFVGLNVFCQYYGKSVSPSFAGLGTDYVSNFHDEGVFEKTAYSDASPESVIASFEDASLVRYDGYYGSRGRYNLSALHNVNSCSMYYSVSNGAVTNYLDEMYLNAPMEQKYSDGDGRLALDLLAGVKYFVSSDESAVPYGFEKTAEAGEYGIYKTDASLGLVYAYENVISADYFATLSPIEKQEAMLCGAVCEAEDVEKIDGITPNSEEIEYTVVVGEGVKYDGKSFTVTRKNAEVTLLFDGIDKSETYAVFDNIGYDFLQYGDVYSEAEWSEMTEEQRANATKKYSFGNSVDKNTITVKGNGAEKFISCFAPDYTYYKGADNFAVNVGYSEKGQSAITLTFNYRGRYNFDKLGIICLPVEGILQNAALLRDTVSDICVNTNSVSCKSVSDKSRQVLFAIPYSVGWKAYVDGEERDVYKTNSMYMSVTVESGEHTVELRYTTPLFKSGLCITCAGILSVIGIALFEIIRKKRHK